MYKYKNLQSLSVCVCVRVHNLLSYLLTVHKYGSVKENVSYLHFFSGHNYNYFHVMTIIEINMAIENVAKNIWVPLWFFGSLWNFGSLLLCEMSSSIVTPIRSQCEYTKTEL